MLIVTPTTVVGQVKSVSLPRRQTIFNNRLVCNLDGHILVVFRHLIMALWIELALWNLCRSIGPPLMYTITINTDRILRYPVL